MYSCFLQLIQVFAIELVTFAVDFFFIIYLLLEKGQTAKLIRPPKQQVQLQYVTGSAKTEHNSAIQIFQYKALKYIG